MRNAQSGDLPLFTWTLGLEQDELLRLIKHCFPELGQLEALSPQEYAVLLKTTPEYFFPLCALLQSHARPSTTATTTQKWLAHAIAAASMGERHLWQDLGLSTRDELTTVLQTFFPGLHARNTPLDKTGQTLKWKRFLFKELGEQIGLPHLQPPGCHACRQRPFCFANQTDILESNH